MATQELTDRLDFSPAQADPGVYQEAFDAAGLPRPHWQPFLEAAGRLPASELVHRAAQAQQLLHENGVNFNVYHEGRQAQRPWELDLVPYIIAAAEWRRLEAGLRQRARLLEAVVRDCFDRQTLIRDGALPPEVLFANPAFRRMFVGLGKGPAMTLAAAELARHPDGGFRVMADRTEAPVGAAFALENRIVTTRTLPPRLRTQHVQRLAPFFITLQNTLRRLGERVFGNPRVVLLSGGARQPFYFEDVYLARYLGYSLVEGTDLAVRDNRVYLKTLAGLAPIDVIVSRGAEAGIDPLELGGGEPHGVPGLLRVLREGKVAVVNRPGAGLVESPVFMAFLEPLCRRCLAEDLLIPSIPTWWCGDPAQRQYVLEHLDDLVIKPAFQSSGGEEILPGRLSSARRAELIERIRWRPCEFVAQALIARSAVPVIRHGEPAAGYVALRAFLAADGDDFAVLPGGLARFAETPGPMELSISAGAGAKDVWVLADAPVEPVTLLTSEEAAVPLRRTSAIFPSRVADDLYWFGIALDRVDFLSRLLREVIERLTAEAPGDYAELPCLLRALADQGQIEPGFAIESFCARLPEIAQALPRMVADADETRGVAAALAELHRLASLERLWISADTYRKVRETAEAFRTSAAPPLTGLVDLLEAVNALILNAAAVSGLIHDGMVRGPAWRLLDVGRRVERARNTSGLVRIVLSHEVPVGRGTLQALLEVIDCRMTYRSRYMDQLRTNAVLDLCITDETCPRSIAFQCAALAEHVDALTGHDANPLRSEEKRAVMAALHAVRMVSAAELEARDSATMVDLLNSLDARLRRFTELLTRKYLLHSGPPRQINPALAPNP